MSVRIVKTCIICGRTKHVYRLLLDGNHYCSKHKNQIRKHGRIIDDDIANRKEITKKKGEEIYLCECCGKPNSHEMVGSKRYCGKHKTQILKYGHTLERTSSDPNEYVITGDYVKVFLLDSKNTGEKEYFLVDVDDFYKYCDGVFWFKNGDGYISKRINNKIVRIHRAIMNVESYVPITREEYVNNGYYDKNSVVDHINGNKLDNRKDNLRITSQRINSLNQTCDAKSSSGYRNVYYRKDRDNWEVKINGLKSKLFENIEDAIEYAQKSREKLMEELLCK